MTSYNKNNLFSKLSFHFPSLKTVICVQLFQHPLQQSQSKMTGPQWYVTFNNINIREINASIFTKIRLI